MIGKNYYKNKMTLTKRNETFDKTQVWDAGMRVKKQNENASTYDFALCMAEIKCKHDHDINYL